MIATHTIQSGAPVTVAPDAKPDARAGMWR